MHRDWPWDAGGVIGSEARHGLDGRASKRALWMRPLLWSTMTDNEDLLLSVEWLCGIPSHEACKIRNV